MQPINNDLEGHGARNEALLARLKELGVNLGEPREIEHHFWCESKQALDQLKKALQKLARRFEEGKEEAGKYWSLTAVVFQSPATAATTQTVSHMVRLGREFESDYDGWGTSV